MSAIIVYITLRGRPIGAVEINRLGLNDAFVESATPGVQHLVDGTRVFIDLSHAADIQGLGDDQTKSCQQCGGRRRGGRTNGALFSPEDVVG